MQFKNQVWENLQDLVGSCFALCGFDYILFHHYVTRRRRIYMFLVLVTLMGIIGELHHDQFHVLAVDDCLLDRKLIERLFKISSYQVTTVDSGIKALEFLGLHGDDQIIPNSPCASPENHQEVEVNLIITDYCMPGMTGYDLLKKVKESSFLRDIPVVIMSSENVPSRISRCLEGGAEEFILKPVKLADVNRLKPHLIKSKRKDQNKKPEDEEQSNKRKINAVEEAEGLRSPQRTRPRYNNGLTL